MQELVAKDFVGAFAELRQIIMMMDRIDNKVLIVGNDREIITRHLNKILEALRAVNARSALASADRLSGKIGTVSAGLACEEVKMALFDIESRFADHLNYVQLFTISAEESGLMVSADALVAIDGFSALFPNTAFEMEEAAKCIALGRYTASVFHAMRMLELGIKAIAKRLNIPDPTKSAERNWAFILKEIKTKIDAQWPISTRMPGTEGAKFDALYASLDAVKNPWRNATMHVENTYAPHEALHILRCSAYFMKELMALSDEHGNDITVLQ